MQLDYDDCSEDPAVPTDVFQKGGTSSYALSSLCPVLPVRCPPCALSSLCPVLPVLECTMLYLLLYCIMLCLLCTV